MPPPTDPEYRALTTIQRALAPLNHEAQRRVLKYISDRLNAHVSFDVEPLMAHMTEAFSAINKAAAHYDITGAQLLGVVLDMYQRAGEQQEAAQNQEPPTPTP